MFYDTVINILRFSVSNDLKVWINNTNHLGSDINSLFKPQNNEGCEIMMMKCLREWFSAPHMIHITATNCSLRSFTGTFLQMKLFRAAAAATRWSYSPPKRMRNLFLKEQPQLLVMDYSVWFGRRAVTRTRGWVSNSLLGFGAVLKCGFKNASLTADESQNSSSKLLRTSRAVLRLRLAFVTQKNMTEKSDPSVWEWEGENELDWCFREEDVACGWRSSRLTACASFQEKKIKQSKRSSEKNKENALPKGEGLVESSSELYDIYNGLWG